MVIVGLHMRTCHSCPRLSYYTRPGWPAHPM